MQFSQRPKKIFDFSGRFYKSSNNELLAVLQAFLPIFTPSMRKIELKLVRFAILLKKRTINLRLSDDATLILDEYRHPSDEARVRVAVQSDFVILTLFPIDRSWDQKISIFKHKEVVKNSSNEIFYIA